MSVIGRMDEQVDEILITPLSRKRQDEPKRETEGDSPPEPPGETATANESAAKDDELPVWLL